MAKHVAGLLLGLLLVSSPLLAQPAWPCDAKGAFYLQGRLPWHPADSTAARRQAVLAAWAAKLTGLPVESFWLPESQRDPRVQLSPDSFRGPGSYWKSQGDEQVYINYLVQLTATDTGLRYHLNSFEISHMNDDSGVGWALEEYPKKQDPFQTGEAFRQWLRATLAAW